MKNTFGSNIAITLFGESHGEMIGAVIDGIAPGTVIDREMIDKKLAQRRPSGKISTARVERDEYRIVSGVFEGRATGTPICILIPNENKKSSDYTATARLARPGHADYTAECKYGGFQDYRGGGHFSGRLTAPIVAAGAIALSTLRARGIYIGTHISSLADVNDRKFNENDIKSDILSLDERQFPTLDEGSGAQMRSVIEAAGSEGDSVGGVLETYVYGVPAGLGEPWFDSVESTLSHAMFSIPGIKGIEFGAGFEISKMRGSAANDALYNDGGAIKTHTNNAGGINGGITNGMPIVFRCAVRPTPSIFKAQSTVDIKTGEAATLELKGRHDPAIIHRAAPVVDCLTALVIADLLEK